MRFEYYCDAAGEWRWRLVAGNNSGEGYAFKRNVLRAIEEKS